MKITGFDKKRFDEIYQIILSKIQFVDEIFLSNEELNDAIELVKGIDEDDALFVALANHLQAKLWTGDKKLIEGLILKKYKRIFTTDTLYQDFIRKESKRISK